MRARPAVNGYLRVWVRGRGYVLEHRYVVEQSIGRQLESHERVHHKNGDRADNRLANLELCSSHREHHQRHLRIPHRRAIELYARGHTASEVATRIGASTAGVLRIVRAAGVARSKAQAAALRPRRANGQFGEAQCR